MFRWYVVNTYSGHEKKVQANLEHRRRSMSQEHAIRRIVVPTEQQVETKDGQKVAVEKRVLPGYVLVEMDANAETVTLVRNTPGVTGFVGMTGGGASHMPVPLSRAEVDRVLHQQAAEAKPKAKIEFTLGQPVKIVSGPLSDFDGEIIEINSEAGKLKVHVSIFERQVPVELRFDEVRKLD
jgi:transcriptional antiterminator NusG